MQDEAGKAPNKKRKAIIKVEVAAVHELERDSDSENGTEDGGTAAQGPPLALAA